jgi:hypothetical protein
MIPNACPTPWKIAFSANSCFVFDPSFVVDAMQVGYIPDQKPSEVC